MVSVPFDVTGEGPTMSLGLKTFIEFEDTRLTELGRNMAESVAGGGDELTKGVSSNHKVRRYHSLHNPKWRPKSFSFGGSGHVAWFIKWKMQVPS